LRERAKAGEEVSADDIITKDWVDDCRTGPSILKVMIKSKATRMIRVGIKFTVKNNENKNVEFPMTEMKENLFSHDTKQSLVFTKIDPSKESWGDISIEVNVKEGKTSQITSSYTSGGYSGGQYQGGSYTGGTSSYNMDYSYYGSGPTMGPDEDIA